MLTTTLLALHRTAVMDSVDVVSRVQDDDLGRPTPCSEWTLADLLAHMIAQHHGFAAAARGAGGDLAVWQVRPVGEDPVGEYAAAAEAVLAAFAEDGAADREFTLAELRPVSRFPGARAIGFHLIDYVVHAWDVARSLGIPYELDPSLAELSLKIAMAVPQGSARLEPDFPFRPALPTTPDASPMDRILTALGRSPTWP